MSQNLTVSEWIIEELIRLGSTQFVISPGSRSTPLTVAAARNPRANTVVHIDERGAAFFALGYARSTGTPAVLICTSGTAVANYFPAVVEASMDNIPLIVLSADRPPELIGVGANQAIFQENIFGIYTRSSVNLPPPEKTPSSEHPLRMIDKVYDASTGLRPGPVHINCQFREPLLTSMDDTASLDATESWRKSKTRYTQKEPYNLPNPSEQIELLLKKLRSNKRGVIIVGRSVDSIHDEAILNLAKTLSWPILPDIQSRLRFQIHPQIINHFDLLLLKKEVTESLPNMVIHFGGAFTSKRLLNYLNHPQIFYVSIKETSERVDPNHQVDLRIQGSLESTFDSIHMSQVKPQADWHTHWQSAEAEISRLIDQQMESEPFISEPSIAYFLSKSLPQNHSLMLGNSMPIREMEMFAKAGYFNGRISGNRGASGIDGLLATAAGYQSGSHVPLTLLIGDLAFLHDLNSLGLIKNSAQPIIVILINNKGGGIFSFLPIHSESDIFESFFATPHELSFEKAADLFSLNYSRANDLPEFEANYLKAHDSAQSTLIEVNTDRSENYALHQRLFDIIRDS
ncbi:MAG: 2-succinyl-5-enolpyruvyl-6-hydroxy-3-cyclohexene-1-carboxylic-acid synthase [Candidatus Marinimicrobia bacterium]|nr:2-succinyl-5-enolpyruvyl-6-hydroxy-3-cyclohexene-1-carboxylic-acid synthase [Candidatus Neomarinimicrobiota bacterium]